MGRKAHGDPWTWNVFVGANGDALGQYLIFSGGHQWADLDTYADQGPGPDASQFNAQAGQYTTSVVNRISQTNASVSNMPEDLSEYSLYRVTAYEIRNQATFMATVAKFHAAAQQTNWPSPYGFSTVIGGPPTVNIVLPARNWAGFKPPEQTVPEFLTEVYGEEGAAELFETFARSWRSASTSTWQFRPDLSLLQP